MSAEKPLGCATVNSPSPTLIATHSGLRGRPGSELSAAVVVRTVGGLLALLRRRQLPVAIAVARDERETSAGLASTVMEAAISSGADVVDLGVLPTPAAKLAARRRDLGGAVIVTGSHLDPELNGLKLVAAPTYGPLDVNELFKPAEAELAGPAATRGGRGRVRADDGATQEHVHAICEAIDAERVRAAKLSASASGSAGAGPAMLLEELGCARPEAHPQIGLRLDADGDRLALIDEQGAALDSELTLALCLLGLEARDVVKGADTSRMIDALAEQRGGNVRTVPPGEIHLVAALAEDGGDLAGEGNGGVVVPAVGLARDGLAAAGTVLWLLARTGRPLSELAAEMPRYARIRSTLGCDDRASGWEALEGLAERVGAAAQRNLGVVVEREAGAWGIARISATEPVIRITAEGPDLGSAEAVHEELRAGLSAR